AEIARKTIGRLGANAQLVLRVDGLEDAAVEDAIAAAHHELAGLAGYFLKPPPFHSRPPGEAESRLEVFVGAMESVLETVLDLTRGAHTLPAHAEIQREVRSDSIVVLEIEVGFVIAVLCQRIAEPFLETGDETAQEVLPAGIAL